ncbi:MAG: (d)CMP kinase [Clostridia bacterium]|nr:(d)CMP kinase [Clostridia bacterium]
MNKYFSVAIDGPAGAGKSTIASTIARKFNCLNLDTGAMYRAAAIWLTERDVDVYDSEAVGRLAGEIDIDVKYVSGVQRVYVSGRDVTDELRSDEISMLASACSKYPEIRSRLVDMQRQMAKDMRVVMDGRDIGTKVLPDASVKIYLVASVEARAKRRLKQLLEKGIDATYERVLADMIKRDHDDSTREFSPLEKAQDAVALDTTSLSLEQSILRAIDIVAEKTGMTEAMCRE